MQVPLPTQAQLQVQLQSQTGTVRGTDTAGAVTTPGTGTITDTLTEAIMITGRLTLKSGYSCRYRHRVCNGADTVTVSEVASAMAPASEMACACHS